LPLADASADVVYTSHMVEHMTRDEARQFLAEARRVLRPGGVLRIAVPDIDYHIGLYSKHGDSDQLVEGLMMASTPPATLAAKLRHLIIGERHHFWMYNGIAMTQLIDSVGFNGAKVMPAGMTIIGDPGELDLAERAPESVFVEATRP
jgi:ubiquinone/menaquinone biosynthesis C-methylase UbiE